MEYINVELKKTKFVCYFFDGTENSAKEFCRKWGGNWVPDFMDKDLTSIVFPSGKKCYARNYIIIDGNSFSAYNKEQFLNTFNVISNYRQGNYSFLSED